MPAKWTFKEKQKHFTVLRRLYVKENKPIGEIGKLLNLSEQTVYDRLKRVGINSRPELKPGYLLFKRRIDIFLPRKHTPELAEFFGIMLGDGNLNKTQIVVTLGTKELDYANYVVKLIQTLFGPKPKICFRKTGHKEVYLGSTQLVEWALEQGLVFNKVASQVDVPEWIKMNSKFMMGVLRGLFDTDGSVYKLRWGMQISFCNRSIPLLKSVRRMLLKLRFSPSKISGYNLYLTKKNDADRFFQEIGFRNRKHIERYKRFKTGASDSGNSGTL